MDQLGDFVDLDQAQLILTGLTHVYAVTWQ